MRSLDHHMGPRSMALVTETVDVVTTLRQTMGRLRQKCRHSLCTVLHGGHELYRAQTANRMYQECLLCGYESPGWTIDRRDRRLHLVGTQRSSLVQRR